MSRRHRLAAGEFGVDDRARSDGDEGHGDDRDGLDHQHPPVRAVEDRPSDEPVGLRDPADDGDDQSRRGDLGVVAGRLHEIRRAGAGENDSTDENRAAEPDADRCDVDEVDQDAEGDEFAVETGEGHARRRSGREQDRQRL